MTRHLDVDERVDALEGTLTGERAAHVETCMVCRDEVEAVRAMWQDVHEAAAMDESEPSPLFWEHFPARVSAAVDQIDAPRAVWWRLPTRTWMSVATAAALVVAVGLWRLPASPVAPAPESAVASAIESSIDDSIEWQFMTDVLDTLDDDEARTVLGPSSLGLHAALTQLTDSERETFARLLEADMTEGSE